MSDHVPTSFARLPSGWTSCKLGDLLFAIEAGKSFTCEPRPARPEEWGIIKVSAMTWGTFDEGENKAVPPSRPIDRRKEIEAGDILVSRSNTVSLVGASVLVGTCRPKLLLSDKSLRLRYSDRISARWLQGSLAAPHARDQLSTHATGTSDSMRNISQDDVLSLRLLLPPRNEQERIADTLDEILSDLDAGVEALKRAQAKLKLYRASVLKAAVTGELTADWRAAHPEAESASDLLARILKERRRLWEAEQLRKYEAAGKHPLGNWKSKYKEPVAPDTTKLPNLPKGWCWVSMEQVTKIQGGLQKTPDRSPRAQHAPYLRVGNVLRGRLDLTRLERFELTPAELDRLRLLPGDVLIVEGNGSRTEIGRNAIWNGEVDDCIHQNHIIRCRAYEGLRADFLSNFLNSTAGQNAIHSVASSTSGLYTLSVSKIASLAIPLAPLEEQEAAMEIVSEQLSVADHVSEELTAKTGALLALRQAALRHAFTGQLVPQDAADEPAHVLLERIALERATRAEARRQKLGAAKKAGSSATLRTRGQDKRSNRESRARDTKKQTEEQAATTA